MPNHTSTILEVHGTKARIKEFMQFVSATEDGKTIPFSCDAVIPMPPELRSISSPVKIVSEKEYEQAILNALKNEKNAQFSPALPLTENLQKMYKEKYGADNWYDWANKNWGTKWGAYDHGEWKLLNCGGDWVASLFFMSAWAPVVPVIEVCASKFPDLKFTLKYADEGGGFLGFTLWEKGGMLTEKDIAWNSREGKELREELGCYYPDDDEDETSDSSDS